MPTPKLRLLLVEDNRDTLRATEKILAGRGYSVSAAASAYDALHRISRETFDLVISDIAMPGMDGWELLKQLRERAPSIKAVTMTGFGYQTDILKSYGAGYQVHLTKPVSIEELEDAIAKLFPEVEPVS